MELFLIGFAAYLVTALALGIGILFRGQAMHASCRGLPDGSSCKSKTLCGGACRRVR